LQGTAPEVTGDTSTNPSDTTTVTVYRTNAYGTSQGTLTIVINNTTAPIVTPIAGVTHEGGTALIDSDTMDDGSVVSIDNIIDVGNRFVIDKEWLDNYVLPKITSGTGDKSVFIGFPASGANWTAISGIDDFILAYEFWSSDAKRAVNNWGLRVWELGITRHNVSVGGQTNGLYDYVLINDGTDIKNGALVASQGHNASTYVYDVSDSNWKQTGGLTGVTSSNRDIVIATRGTDLDLDLQYFNEYAEPTAPSMLTSWNKAIDFNGSNQRAQMVAYGHNNNPLLMGGVSTTVGAPLSSVDTSNDINARPWATAIVFKSDNNSSNQHIWNQGEGADSNDDNIYLRVASNRQLFFGWGRDGALNECLITTLAAQSGQWYGIYIAHNGTRLSSANATAANLAAAFDIRVVNLANGSVGVPLTSGNWGLGTTGGRMDRQNTGAFTVGGRGANRSFHGKVASMVITTLKRNVAMPTDAEIQMMVTDPMRWLQDYKAGQSYRRPESSSNSANFQVGGSLFMALSTQVWLMGDGSNDSYSNMIRNRVMSSDQNYTKLNLISMVSNDIETVNIPGLS
jgi:hypothetical protein